MFLLNPRLAAKLRDDAQRLGLAGPDQHRGDRGRLPAGELIPHMLARADQRDRVDQFVGHGGLRLVLLAGEVEVLQLGRQVFVAEVADVAVVKVLVARAHPADIEGEARLDRLAALVEIGTHHAGHIGREIEIARILAGSGFGETGVQVGLEELVVPIGAHPDRQDTVGQLGGELDSFGADRRGVDLHIRPAVQNTLERLAESARAGAAIRNLILLAVETERFLPFQDLADDRDIFAITLERLAVWHAVPALDYLRIRGADPDQKTAIGQAVEGHRRHRGHGRGPRLHLQDSRAQLDLRGARADEREKRNDVGAPRLAGPDRFVAEAFGFEDYIHRLAHPRTRI